MENVKKGFKVVHSDMTASKPSGNPVMFECGKTYSVGGDIAVFKNGFHFCETLRYCFEEWTMNEKNRVFEVEASGEIKTYSDEFQITSCCRKIRFIRELTWGEVYRILDSGPTLFNRWKVATPNNEVLLKAEEVLCKNGIEHNRIFGGLEAVADDIKHRSIMRQLDYLLTQQ